MTNAPTVTKTDAEAAIAIRAQEAYMDGEVPAVLELSRVMAHLRRGPEVMPPSRAVEISSAL